mmetsp:Transcript_25710/g.74364  ORF Transcript_25710/g.74364 Transcript_25710/m.74364 type:complete len:301 (+) Transcript_25710:53-955(+)
MARLVCVCVWVCTVLRTSAFARTYIGVGDLIADGRIAQTPSPDDIFHGKVPAGYLSNVGVMASEAQILKFIQTNSYSFEQQMQKMVNTLHNFNQSDGMLQPEDLEPSDDHKENMLKLMWAFCGKKRPTCMIWPCAAMDILIPDLSNPSAHGPSLDQIIKHGLWFYSKGASQVKEYLESIPNSEKFPLSCQDPLNRVLIDDTNFNGWHLIHLISGMEMAYVPQWLYELMGDWWNDSERGIQAGSYDGALALANQCHKQESGLQIGFIDVWKPTAADLYYRDLGRKWMTQWMKDKQLPDVAD